MATISWKESLPSENSKVGISPPEIRAHKQAIAQWLGEWLIFPGSGGGSENSAGIMKAGAARPYYAAASASSNAGTENGKLFFASDTSRLYAYDSTGTYCVGTPSLIEAQTDVDPQYAYVFQSGQSYVSAPNNPSQSFCFSADGVSANVVQFVSAPVVLAYCSHGSILLGVSTVTEGGFSSTASWWGSGDTSAYTVFWRASGYTRDSGNTGAPLYWPISRGMKPSPSRPVISANLRMSGSPRNRRWTPRFGLRSTGAIRLPVPGSLGFQRAPPARHGPTMAPGVR